MATMPPVPEHRHSWRGTPLVLDIQREGASRMRLTSHSNEYVGLLRERLARQLGCSSKNVRMLYMGESRAFQLGRGFECTGFLGVNRHAFAQVCVNAQGCERCANY